MCERKSKMRRGERRWDGMRDGFDGAVECEQKIKWAGLCLKEDRR